MEKNGKPAELVSLRDVEPGDLDQFFTNLQDAEAIRMAAFTPENPADRSAFDAHWIRIMGNPAITIRTIMYGQKNAGHVASFTREGDLEVTYWVGRDFWGRGLATLALGLFLEEVTSRPVFARVVKDNRASIRVLEKCGFTVSGQDKGFAHGRGAEVEEWVMILG